MSATALIEDLSRQSVALWADGEKLRYRGPKAVLTPELLDELRASKPELMPALQSRPVGSTAEVLGMVRTRFETEPFDPDEHPPPPGMLADRGSDKARFFAKGDAWRDCWPREFDKGGKA